MCAPTVWKFQSKVPEFSIRRVCPFVRNQYKKRAGFGKSKELCSNLGKCLHKSEEDYMKKK